MRPDARFAHLSQDRVVCHVVGADLIDVVVTPGLFGSMDVEWDVDALGPAPLAELLHVLMLPDFGPTGSASTGGTPRRGRSANS